MIIPTPKLKLITFNITGLHLVSCLNTGFFIRTIFVVGFYSVCNVNSFQSRFLDNCMKNLVFKKLTEWSRGVLLTYSFVSTFYFVVFKYLTVYYDPRSNAKMQTLRFFHLESRLFVFTLLLKSLFLVFSVRIILPSMKHKKILNGYLAFKNLFSQQFSISVHFF